MKRLTQTLAFCLLTVFTAVAQKNYVSEVWVSDLGNGKYKNPVLYADYSDPDACRVGDDFYMTSSSFNCLPGLQILHSKDLVNWTIIGAAVPNALSLSKLRNGRNTAIVYGLRLFVITTVSFTSFGRSRSGSFYGESQRSERSVERTGLGESGKRYH